MYVPTQIFFTAKQNDQDPDLEQYLHNYDVCSKKVSTCILYIYIYILWVVNAVVTVLVFLGLTVQVFRFLQKDDPSRVRTYDLRLSRTV